MLGDDWKSAGFSGVEVRRAGPDEIHVRNSNYPEEAPLVYTDAEWDAFLHGVKNREFDDLVMP